VRKRLPLISLLIFFIVVAITGWWYLRPQPTQAPTTTAETSAYQTTSLKLGGTTFDLDIADTPAKKELGLGKRPILAVDRGMVFPYDKPGKLCYWMKDMHFAIDILWLEKSLSPDTYPQTFCPDELAKYVVELPAGVSDQAGLRAGDILPLDL
jgi:uncharacterized membrane protein (UPF0127 family)